MDIYSNKKPETLDFTGFRPIGVARLELAASTSLTWRASQLRYTPVYKAFVSANTKVIVR